MTVEHNELGFDMNGGRIVATTGPNHKDRFIGYTEDCRQIFVSAELAIRSGPDESVNHIMLTDYYTFSMMGTVYDGAGQFYSGGQCIEELDDIVSSPLSREQLDTLKSLWRDCHSNTMKAPCVHQSGLPFWKDIPYGDRPAYNSPIYKAIMKDQQERCPQGYAWGSKWLVEPMTDQQIGAATVIIALLNEQKGVGSRYRSIPVAHKFA